jgi:hypothetical protein
MKYKLIKEYPGSPELGTIHCNENKIMSWKGTDFYESYPEYWENINDNLWWVVFNKNHVQDGKEYFSAWTAHQIECIYAPWDNSRDYFKTKEEAENFILYNKPCLSYNDVLLRLRKNQNLDLDCLEELVKSLI